ncbi:ABC transporter B family member 15-like [Mercurialis annua]|uniref:ABC transporter B family member 15-like n=1 Tax=Mercurialis annua TaxID=3986 RepID=UPI0021600A01|nr:ABC transporter B family member 15-like [Mercurialis annua]
MTMVYINQALSQVGSNSDRQFKNHYYTHIMFKGNIASLLNKYQHKLQKSRLGEPDSETEMGSLFRYTDWIDKLLMLIGTLGSIGDGLLTPLNMYTLSGLFNEYATSESGSSVTLTIEVVDKYSLRLLYCATFVGISAFLEGICWTRTAERQASRMRMEYLRSVLRQEVGFFDKQATSNSNLFQVISAISSDAHLIQDTIADKIPNLLAHLSSFIFAFVVSFILSWRLALATLPFAIMFIVPGVLFGKLLMNIGGKAKDAYSVAGGIAEQAISSIRTVYSYVGEHQTLERFGNALQNSTKLGIKQGFAKGLLIGSMGMIFAAWSFSAWVGSFLVTEKGEKGGPVFVSGTCVILGGISLMNALPNLTFLSEATIAAIRMNKMIDQIPVIDNEDKKGKILPHIRGEIEFKEVKFSYPSRPDSPILKGLNLKVQAGKTVGLVGGSGSGKSTIISLLERFYDPVSGNILIDGCKIKKLQLQWLRSQIGLVNQEPILFATSIKENILFGNEEASMESIERAAKAANAHDFILKLPDGYETQVGQFGAQLSGGQKQRIAIARALIRDPKILLLDEATSALDAGSEKLVQQALDRASVGRTTIVVAHRLSTIRDADLIVVLESGRVIESGCHNELIQLNEGEGGAYNKMVQLQQSTTQDEASYPSYSPTERINHRNMPTSARSSYQSSPANAFSPVFPISIPHSVEIYTSDEENDDSHLKKSVHPYSSQWRILKMNAPEWKRALLGCIGAAGFGAVQPAHGYCLGSVVSVYFLSDNSKIKSETRTYCFIFLAFAVISFFTNLLQHYNFAVMGERLIKRVREKMLDKIFTFEVGWFDEDENTSAAISARLATEAQLVRSLIAERMSLLVQVFFSTSIAFVVGLLITWRVAIVMIAIQPLLIGSFYSRSVLMKSMSYRTRKAQTEGSQLASEAIINHRTITAFSSQKRILKLFKRTMKDPRKETIKQSWISGFGLMSSQFLTTASVAITFWYGGTLVAHGTITSKRLFQVFFLLMSTGKSIADAGSMSSDIAKGSDAVRLVFAILDRKTEIEPDDPSGVKARRNTKGNIEFKNVCFSYPARPNQMIFKDLSLKIESGKITALVGQSGSGKSTVIGLIERFYDPQSGSIMIDGYDIKSYNLRKLRSHIALVSQEPTLFAGSIRENIVYGCEENVTEGEVRKAAILANAHEFISSMKDGYETYCGERGVQLSGGQKQRIALARAILKNPKILLLDEATSALDSASENLVQEALEKMMIGRTCVVVAHRLSTIQKADSIAVIKNGKVVEKGSHTDLLAIGRHGAYYSLINLQGGGRSN